MTPAKAKEQYVATLPSVSYSITVRLELDAGGSAVGSLTNAVEQVGGMITALDVAAAGHERIRIDVTPRPSSTPSVRSRGSRSTRSVTAPS